MPTTNFYRMKFSFTHFLKKLRPFDAPKIFYGHFVEGSTNIIYYFTYMNILHFDYAWPHFNPIFIFLSQFSSTREI